MSYWCLACPHAKTKWTFVVVKLKPPWSVEVEMNIPMIKGRVMKLPPSTVRKHAEAKGRPSATRLKTTDPDNNDLRIRPLAPHPSRPWRSYQSWVNLSKRGGKDEVFQGLAGLLRGISRRRSPREIPKSSPASPRKTFSFLTLLLRFTFFF